MRKSGFLIRELDARLARRFEVIELTSATTARLIGCFTSRRVAEVIIDLHVNPIKCAEAVALSRAYQQAEIAKKNAAEEDRDQEAIGARLLRLAGRRGR